MSISFRKVVVSAFAAVVVASVGVFAPCAFAALPEGYTPVGYVQGNGTDAYFVTDFKPNPQTDKMEFEIEVMSFAYDETLFSARANSQSDSWTLYLSSGGSAMRYDYARTKNTLSNRRRMVGTRYIFTVENNVFSWSGGEGAAPAAVSTFTQTSDVLQLFAANNNGTSSTFGRFRLFSAKIWRSGELIHNLKPVLDAQGNATLYDDVASGQLTVTRHGEFRSGKVFSFNLPPQPLPASGGACPHPTVTVGAATLAEGSDYQLSWSDNGAPGRASITVTGLNGYAGIEEISRFTVLPSGAQVATSIKGDGVATFIETGLSLNPQTDIIAAVLSFDDNTAHGAVFSARSGTGGTPWALLLGSDNFRYDYKSAGSTQYRIFDTGSIYTFAAENNVLVWSHGEGATASKDTSFVTPGGNLAIFAAQYSSAPGGYNNLGNYWLSSFRIWRSGELIHDLVPIVDENNRVTLCDNVDNPLTLTIHGAFRADVSVGYAMEAVLPQVHHEGFASEPRPVVTFDGVPLTEGSDFTYSWANNTEPGTGTVSAIGLNAHAELNLSQDFEILPSIYDQIPFVQGDGTNAFADTDLYLNPQTDTIEMEFSMTDLSTEFTFFSARADNGRNSWTFCYGGQGDLTYTCSRSGGAGTLADAGLVVGKRYAVTATVDRIVWSGGDDLVITKDGSFTQTGGTLKLFAKQNQGELTDSGNFRLYSFKIRRNGVLIHNLIPVQDNFGKMMVSDDAPENAMRISCCDTFCSSDCLKLADIPPQRYKSRPVTPILKVSKNGVRLAQGTDYDVEWSDNAAPGVGQVKIIGKGASAGLSVRRKFAILPKGVVPVEYVVGDGTSSYFDTDYVPNPQRDMIEVEMWTDDTTRNQTLFSARADNGGETWTLFYTAQNEFRYDYKSVSPNFNRTMPACTRVTFRAQNEFFSWSHGLGLLMTADPTFLKPGGTLTLYAAHYQSGTGPNKTNGHSNYRFYGAKIFTDDALAHWFVPVLDAQGAATVMDVVTALPVTVTRWGGDFTPGPERKGEPSGLMIFFR